jgi:hypothetical protein
VSGEGNRGGSWQLLKGKRKGGGAAFVPVLRKWPESVERCGDMCQCLVVVASSFRSQGRRHKSWADDGP